MGRASSHAGTRDTQSKTPRHLQTQTRPTLLSETLTWLNSRPVMRPLCRQPSLMTLPLLRSHT